MTTNLPIITSPKSKKKKKIDSSIPKWTVFSLCIVTILVVIAITKAIIPLLFFGLLIAFIWSQATKPIAEFERAQKTSGKQLNLFHQQQIGNKHTRDRIKDEKESRAA